VARGFVSQTAVGIAGNGVGAIVSLAYVSLLGHRLTPAEYGVVIAALSGVYVLALVLSPLESGVSKMASHFHGIGQPGGLNTLAFQGVRRLLVPCAVLLAVWWPASYLVRPWLHMDIQALMWLGVLWVASIPTSVVRGVLRGDLRFRDAAFSQVVDAVVRFGVGLLAIFLGARANGALGGYVAGVAVSVVYALWQLRDVRAAAPIPVDPAELWQSSLPLASMFLFLAFVANADVLAAKHYLPADQAGVYGAAATLVRMLYLGTTPIYQVLFSHVAARHAQNQRSRRLTWVVALSLGALLLASLVIPVFFGAPLLGLIFGADYTGAAPALRILWLTTSLLVLEALAAHAMIGANRTRGAWAFLLPCAAMSVALWRFHADLVQIAYCGLFAASLGGLVTLLMAALTRQSNRSP
jgi:O-antigen/teichoic acid export membrane protein